MARPDDAATDEISQDEIDRLAEERELAAGYREAARRALAFARLYREEEDAPDGERERACITQAQLWRRAVRDLHAGRPLPSLPARPGVAPARPREGASDDRKTG